MAGNVSVDEFFENAIRTNLVKEIEDRLQREIPSLISAAVAKVAVDVHRILAIDRDGVDLRILIKNVYGGKPE
jgi:uncharacterized protein YbcI